MNKVKRATQCEGVSRPASVVVTAHKAMSLKLN